MLRFRLPAMPLAILFFFTPSVRAGDGAEWRQLAPGMDLGTITAPRPDAMGDARISVLRIDPNRWQLEFAGTSQTGGERGTTAREWCKRRKFTAAINAGMFGTDHETHVGYLRYREHVNSAGINAYQSVVAFDPRDDKDRPRFRIFDLDSPGTTIASILEGYSSAVQNLRLIKRPGSNRWSPQNKKWSEAALGEDGEGRILFIFSRTPFSMHDLNHALLGSGIGIVAAQHLEGGPEAQLYVEAGGVKLEMIGSYETSFREDDGNSVAWPIPNVLGVRKR